MLDLENKTGFSFEYKHDMFEKNNPIINLKMDNKPLSEILWKIFDGIPFIYKIQGKSIIILPKQEVPKKVQKPGLLSGFVFDTKTKSPIYGATIRIGEQSISTDSLGRFTVSLNPGIKIMEISFIGYFVKKVIDIPIESNKKVDLNIPLEQDNGQLAEITVTAKKLLEAGTTSFVIQEIRSANTVMSGISKEQIGRSQDRDASEIVKRIPSVSIIQDKFIVVRGLPQRYNSVMLNGSLAPSFEADSRAFSFDILPSGVIDRIMLYKTASAELPGDFAGAVVKIHTSGIPRKDFLRFSYQSSYRQGSSLQDFYEQYQGKKSWLGYDDGTYGLSKEFKKAREVSGRIDLMSVEERRPLNKEFNQHWEAGQRQAPLDLRFNLEFGKAIELKDNNRLGFTAGLSYSNTHEHKIVYRSEGKYDGLDVDKYTMAYLYNDQTYSHKVRLNGLFNVAFDLKNNHHFEFRNLYTHMGNDIFVDRLKLTGKMTSDGDAGYHIKQNYLLNTYRGTYLGQLSGSHHFFNKKSELNWQFAYNLTKFDDPDQRAREFVADTSKYYGSESLKERGLDGVIVLQNNRGRQYTSLPDTSKSFGLDFTQKFNLWDQEGDIKAGVFLEKKGREFEFIQLGYIKDDPRYSSGSLISENYGKNNSYTASNMLKAGYLMFDLPIYRFKLSSGLRVEDNLQELHTYAYETSGDLANSKIDLNRHHRSFLPSVNLSYQLDDHSLIRTAYSKTLNRPEFREIASFYYKDNFTGRLAYGNPNLAKQTDIVNYDLRYELYPSEEEMFHVGLFYKKFKNPIEFIYYVGTSSRDNFVWNNAPEATNYGAELEFMLKLNRYIGWESWLGRQLQYLTLNFNAAYIKSKVNLGNLTVVQANNRPLAGQSPYLINSSLYYTNDKKGLKLSLSHHVIGKRLAIVGNTDYPDIYELPQNLLDLSFSKRIRKIWEIKGGIQNMLNSRSLMMQDINRDGKFKVENGNYNAVDNRFESYYSGTYFTLSVGINL